GPVQSVTDVRAYRAHEREQAQAEAGGPVKVREVDVLARIDDVAAVEERDAADAHALDVTELRAELEVRLEQLGAADRHDALVAVHFTHQLGSKPALAEAALGRRTAGEVALGDWNVAVKPAA